MTIQLKPEQEKVIEQAILAGLVQTPDEVVEAGVETVRQQLEELNATPAPMTADEWIEKFRAWAHSHPTNTPLLSDEAMSREFIYRERGL